jgi:PAS domain S-box-containing protein
MEPGRRQPGVTLRAVRRYSWWLALAWSALVICLFTVTRAVAGNQLQDIFQLSRDLALEYVVFWLCGLVLLLYTVLRATRRVQEGDEAIARLRESEVRYRTLMECAQAPIAVAQQERYVYANSGFCQLLGVEPGELTGILVSQTQCAEERELLLDRCQRRMRGEDVPSIYESRLVRRDGSAIWVEVNTHVVTYEGAPAVQVEYHDINARKLAELALGKSEEQFRSLVEQMNDWVWEVDAGGKYTYASPQVQVLLGYAPEEVLGRTPYDLMPPEEAQRVQPLADGIFARHEPFRLLANFLLHKDGRRLLFETSGAPFFDEQGRLKGYRGVDRDVSAREEAEQALKRSEEQFRSLVENMREGIVLADPAGVIQFVNRAAAQMVGLEPELLLGRSVLEITPVTEHGALLSEMQRRLEGAGSSYETRIMRSDGTTMEVQVNAAPRNDASGNYCGPFILTLDITERKQAQRALQHSEARFRGLVEGTSDLIATTDGAGRFTYINPVFERVLGYSAEQIAGRDGWEFMHREDLARVQPQIMQQMAAGQTSLQYECRAIGAQGQEHCLLWTADIQRGEDGNPTSAYIIAHDITARKQVEAETRLNEARLETMERLSQMAEADEHELCHFALDEGVALTGSQVGYLAFVSEDEQVLEMYAWNKAALDVCNTEAKPLIYPVAETGLWGEAVRQRRPVITNDYAAPNPCNKGLPEGHVNIWRHMNVPVFSGDKIVAVAGVGNKDSDYTPGDTRQLSLLMNGMWSLLQRQRALGALRESETKLRAFAEQPVVGFKIMQHDRVLYANQAVSEMLGYAHDIVLGWSLHDVVQIFHNEDRVRMLRVYEELLDLRNPQPVRQLEFRVNTSSGAVKWLMMHITRTELGGAPAIISLLTDITERKAAETALLQRQREESISTLAGGIAHDFNNILLGVLGSSTLLAETLPPGHSGADLCEMIATSARRMADLTAKLLAYARGGKHEPVPLDVNAAVHDTVRMLRGSQPSQVRLQLHLAHDLWPIEADQGQLHQVLLNLAFNAFEAMNGAGGTLAILTDNCTSEDWVCGNSRDHAAGDYVHICVRDDGPGMDEATCERVFEPYFSTKAQGRGLGLAAVQGIVRNHGGCISVQSAPQRGTAFHIYLPRGKRRPSAGLVEAPQSSDGRETVLIVDDEELVLSVASRILSRHGYVVLAAADATAGLELVQRYSGCVDLALIDVQMPVMDGIELLKALREQGFAGRALLSSGFNDTPLSAMLPAGMAQGFLSKPYSASELLQAVRAQLDSAPEGMAQGLKSRAPE